MKGKNKVKQAAERGRGCWPVTYRFVAMGTLVAYTAFGASKLALASPFGANSGKNGPNSSTQSQALVVRRFEIPEGTLFDALANFEKTSGIHVSYAEEGLKQLHTAGV